LKIKIIILLLLLTPSVFANYETIGDVVKQLGGAEYAYKNSIMFYQANFTILYRKGGKVEKITRSDYKNVEVYFFRKDSEVYFSLDKKGKELLELVSIQSNHDSHEYKIIDTNTNDVIHSFDLGFRAKLSKYLSNSNALFTDGKLEFEVDYKNNKIVKVSFLHDSDEEYLTGLLYKWSFKDKYKLNSYSEGKRFSYNGDELYLLHRSNKDKTEFIIFSKNESRVISKAITSVENIGYGYIDDIFVYSDNVYFSGFSSDGGVTPQIYQLNEEAIINFGGNYGGQIIPIGNGKAFMCIDKMAKILDLDTNRIIDKDLKVRCPSKFDLYMQGPMPNTLLYHDPDVA